jgi:streptolysin S family bacteriocin protoxin
MSSLMIRFTSHASERRRRSTTIAAAGSCCCSCCCVHTVGGLGGAIYGSLRRDAPDPEALVTEKQIGLEAETAEAHRYAVKTYWLALTFVCFLTLVVSAAFPGLAYVGRGLGIALIIGFLPIGQLLASLISLVVIRTRPPVRKDLSLRRLGRITLIAFIGAVVGILGTVLTFTMF